MDERFAKALIQAASQRATSLGGSPNQTASNASQMANLQNLAQLKFQDQGSAGAAAAFGGNANAVADVNERRAQNEARIAEINADTQQKLAAMEAAKDSPENFRREPAEDGGWNFFDGRGNPISARDYAKATGKQITQVLDGSNNPKDVKFKEEYQQLMEYGRALSGDQDAANKFKEKNKSWLEGGNKGKTYEEVVRGFRDYWKDYMQPRQLDNLSTTDAGGRDIRMDTLSSPQSSGNPILDWIGRNKRLNVNYR